MKKVVYISFILLGALSLSGCAAVVLGAAATTGVVAVQERSIGHAVDDTAIRTALNARLLSADADAYRNISTESVEGRVLLTGFLTNPNQKANVIEIARSIDGVREVIDEIRISDTIGFVDSANDVWISSQLRTRLVGDKDIMSINYTIETMDAVVYLIGVARDDRELSKVVNHARRVKGVKQVVSHVLTRNDPRRLQLLGISAN
jgi:osmotically-inducible protein OsmY